MKKKPVSKNVTLYLKETDKEIWRKARMYLNFKSASLSSYLTDKLRPMADAYDSLSARDKLQEEYEIERKKWLEKHPKRPRV